MDDFDIVYSIEWVDKSDIYDCWNQHATTRSYWLAKLQKFEAKRIHGRNKKYRIREV